MIIIKSQDGIILEVKQINPSGKQIVSGIFNEEVSDGMGGTIEVINYLTLGMYETEKRACEVMSEIEQCIRLKTYIECFKDLQYFTGDKNLFGEFVDKGLIYEMPQD